MNIIKCISNNKLHKLDRSAFTLAEVLITLGIIGVVAALIMPTIINNYKYKQFSTAIQKQYSAVNQALKHAIVDYGDTGSWNYQMRDVDFVNQYFAPYLKLEKSSCWVEPNVSIRDTDIAGEELLMLLTEPLFGQPAYATRIQRAGDDDAGLATSEKNAAFSLPDGACLKYNKSSLQQQSNASGQQGSGLRLNRVSISHYYIYIDVNGRQKPNQFGFDRFVMEIDKNKNIVQMRGAGEDTNALTSGEESCSSEGNGCNCGALLQANNWDIDPNYRAKVNSTNNTCGGPLRLLE